MLACPNSLGAIKVPGVVLGLAKMELKWPDQVNFGLGLIRSRSGLGFNFLETTVEFGSS